MKKKPRTPPYQALKKALDREPGACFIRNDICPITLPPANKEEREYARRFYEGVIADDLTPPRPHATIRRR